MMKFVINRKLILKLTMGLALIVISFILYTAGQQNENFFPAELPGNENIQNEQVYETSTDDFSTEETIIVVDVSGEVRDPSVYLLPNGSRVYEAVEAAGGLTAEADTRNTNLAAPLKDGTKLYIPSRKDLDAEQKATGELPGSRYINSGEAINNASITSLKNGLININTADSAELQKLTGIGPVTAGKIIAYRNEFGSFKTTEELLNVNGIGEKTFARLKNNIVTE
ncbi:MAG TPA: helix-hairpin-helix domain-containing protein [Bacillota bacterium]|nr:helix-hairpin-helix domain-containing protein [Bacillota bacterium]